MTIHHKKFGEGVVTDNNGTVIIVEFKECGEKRLSTVVSAANEIISIDTDEYMEIIKGCQDLLKRESFIRSSLSSAEKEFSAYADYLD